MMEWEMFLLLFQNLFVLPFGSTLLAGLVLTVVVLYACGRAGLGADGSVMIGGGFLFVFSVAMLPFDITIIITLLLSILFAIGVLKVWRK